MWWSLRYHAEPISSSCAAAGFALDQVVRRADLHHVSDGAGQRCLVRRPRRWACCAAATGGRGRRRAGPRRPPASGGRPRAPPRRAGPAAPATRPARARRHHARPSRGGAPHIDGATDQRQQPRDARPRPARARGAATVGRTPNRSRPPTSSTTRASTRNGWSRSGHRSGPELGRPVDDDQRDHGEEQQPAERPPPRAGAAPVDPQRRPGGTTPGRRSGSRWLGRAGHRGGRQHRRRSSASGSVVNLPPKPRPLRAGGHRGRQHAGQVDRHRHQAEQRPATEHPPEGRPVAAQQAVDQAGQQHDDQHDRAEDVADGDQQVAEHQRRQRVGAAQHRPAQRPPHPRQERPDHLAGRPRGQVEVLRHPAHRHGDGGDVRRGRRRRRRSGPGGRRRARHRPPAAAFTTVASTSRCGTTVASSPIPIDQRGPAAPHWPSAARLPGPPGVGVDGAATARGAPGRRGGTTSRSRPPACRRARSSGGR